MLGFPSLKEFWVHRDIIDAINVVYFDLSASISIEDSEGFLHHIDSSFGELFSKTTQEFIVADVSITVDIVEFHKSLELNLLWEDAESSKSLFEFARV